MSSLDTDDEILQDFMVEAGEILELLSEQLVDLESKPENSDLLNAIFRGFHTVKGGAGFLALTNLVGICHIAENVFDILRQGKRNVNAEMMDVFLKTLDSVNEMFAEIKDGKFPSAAEKDLLKQLESFAVPGGGEAAKEEPVEEEVVVEEAVEETVEEPEEQPTTENEGITEDEFESLLDTLHGSVAQKDETKSEIIEEKGKGESEDISEEEFERLLDELSDNKEGKSEEEEKELKETKEVEKLEADSVPEKSKNIDNILTEASKGGDTIEDDEFEALLDQLSGAGTKSKEAPVVEEVKKSVESAKPAKEKEPEFKKPIESAKSAKEKEPELKKPIESAKSTKEKEPVVDEDSKQPTEKQRSQRDTGITAETTVRVDTSRLDEIMNMVGELVLVRNRLVKLRGDSSDDSMSKAVNNLDVVTADLQMAVMKTRMQPIKKVFGRFPRVVRDLARSLKKEVNLEMEGEETDLDKNLVEALSDPLVHLVRNSVDHGVESPADREKAGKPRAGRILLSAEQAGDHILLSITDDGKGIDADVLRRNAVNKGLLDEDAAARLDNVECYNLIFMPGFSTKEEISDISGRGVGMDVVKTKISQLNGTIEIDSKKGVGSKISIKVPLTLAILPTLMVVVGEQTFALPLTSVNEIFNLDLTKTNIVDGQLVIIVREKAVPLFYLQEWLLESHSAQKKPGKGHVVIVSIGTQRIGFVVDGLVGQEEVVIKALGDMLQGTAGMAGATITGDGKIAMILDVPTLLDKYV